MPGYKQIDDIDIPDDFVLPEGNVRRGQLLFKKHCAQCHAIRRDGKNPYGTLWGPSLYGIMGRTAAQNQRTGASKYSVSLEESGILWTERNMMAFLKNPRSFAGGVINMNFRGIDSLKDRVDLVHYLKRAGHESWMVQDGTPHSQKGWWKRDKQPQSGGGALQSLNDFVAQKAEALNILGRGGLAMEPAGGVPAAVPEDDPELKRFRKVQRVVDGVRTASMQQSFNWPPPEEIAAGPLKRQAGRSPSMPQDTSPLAGTSAADEDGLLPPPPGGIRAPSGLTVYADIGGPASAVLLQKAAKAA
mmetsp:Transcript_61187/g.157817  ORF Transcript_61187/g.157817 Transcript_61187/m.157817 type:complete len:302 (+) Transcript_61187:92-997(+)